MSNPTIYPVPAEEIPATDYAVKVNGQNAFTHPARVSAYPVNEFMRDYQRPLEQTEIASFASWDMTQPVDVEGTFGELQRRFGTYPCPQDVCEDIQVRRCVIWCDWGRSLEIGAKTQIDEIRDLVFEDCDLIHVSHVALSVHSVDRALCRKFVYRNIRIELDDEPRRPVIVKGKDTPYETAYDGYLPAPISVSNQVGYVTVDSEHGRIEDLRFENIDITAPTLPPSRLMGNDADHPVRRIRIENLRFNGEAVTDLERAGIKMNEFVEDVTIR